MSLGNEFIWNWSEENWLWWICDDARWKWLFWFALQDDTLAFSESVAAFLIVGLNAGQEFVTALRGLDVFNTDVDTLGEDLSTVTFVYNNTQSVFRDVVDASSLSVVSLEWHTFVDCSVTLKQIN